MTKHEQTPESAAANAIQAARTTILLLAAVFGILTLVGAGMLAFALMGRGGVLLGVVGGLQTFGCSAVLGALVRRWRSLG